MRKIPTLFVRDFSQRGAPITREYHPDALWVPAGAGIATRKYDGTAALVKDGELFKRYQLRPGKTPPAGFIPVDHDEETGKTVGWVPVGDGPDDKWFNEALEEQPLHTLQDGTYELIGPKTGGGAGHANPEGLTCHELVYHAEAFRYPDAPTGYDELAEWLAGKDIEGLVWHHPDGYRKAKIKLSDFGIKRGVEA